MKGFSEFFRNWKNVHLVLVYLAAAFLVYLLFPREGKFRFEYTRNMPWMHETLVAPFDFPIYKSEQQLLEERDSIRRSSLLYFRYDSLVGQHALSSFVTDYDALALSLEIPAFPGNISAQGREIVLNLLGGIYQEGILARNPVLEQEDRNLESLMLMSSGLAEEKATSQLYTSRSAFEFLQKQLEELNITASHVLASMNLGEYIRPNLLYDAETTSKIREAAIGELSLTEGMVQSGQRIIARGELVTQREFLIIESLRKEFESNQNVGKSKFYVYIGQALLIILIFLALFWFIFYWRKDVLSNVRYTTFILMLIVGMVALTRATAVHETISFYVIPFILVPIFLKTFFDSRFALYVHFITLLLAAFWVPNSYLFVLMNFLVGVVSIFSLRSYYKRGILFYTALAVLASYAAIYTILSLLQEGDFSQVDWINLLWLGGNALLVMTVYPLVFLFERLFGFLSDATLFELSDSNQSLLRELAEKAPGTFQHSMQVASLAEEVVLKTGGNPLLVRAGALYHDIGKMENPQFFIENQMEGHNPHQDMDYKRSARIIIDHVNNGIELARKNKLPDAIVDFIRTHHGTSTVQYFYRSWLNANPEQEVDESQFQYPGPKPGSRETAIVMMADTVEAASRTLKEYSRESISALVNKLIDNQASDGQFSRADITFSDISAAREIFINRLANIYHSRIEYPEKKEA